jgi:hypothetical protein
MDPYFLVQLYEPLLEASVIFYKYLGLFDKELMKGYVALCK